MGCGLIVEGRGKHFGPYIVDLLIAHRDELYRLYRSFDTNRVLIG